MDVHRISEYCIPQAGAKKVLCSPRSQTAAEMGYCIRDNRQNLHGPPGDAQRLPER